MVVMNYFYYNKGIAELLKYRSNRFVHYIYWVELLLALITRSVANCVLRVI